MQEEGDAATKEWLVNVMSNQRQSSIVSNRASRRFSTFDRPRKSIFCALARLASVVQKSPERTSDEVPPTPILISPHTILWMASKHGKYGRDA
jgi:hypothetical protein